MILDYQNKFSTAQAVTSTASSTYYIDTQVAGNAIAPGTSVHHNLEGVHDCGWWNHHLCVEHFDLHGWDDWSRYVAHSSDTDHRDGGCGFRSGYSSSPCGCSDGLPSVFVCYLHGSKYPCRWND